MELLVRVHNKIRESNADVELLFRSKDKVNPSELLDVKCLKRGDVIAVVADGWNWQRQELINPDWRIIKAPLLTEDDTLDFTDQEAGDDPMCQRRQYMIDFSHPAITQSFLDYLADDTRSSPYYETPWTSHELLAVKVIRPSRKV